MEEIDLDNWVESSSGSYDQKVVIHILLHAIGSSENLRTSMIMKGGNLLGIRYSSKRYTKDVDFSTGMKYRDFNEDSFKRDLNEALVASAGALSYPYHCWVQRMKVEPNPEGTYPTLKINIGYANTSVHKEKKWIDSGVSQKVLNIDYSFNEATYNNEIIQISDDASIIAYSIEDVMAEKIRSVLQQPVRRRNREQDIYDINYLLQNINFDDTEKFKILDSLINKSAGRGIEKYLHEAGLDDEEVKQRSKTDYHLLSQTVNELPEFDEAYNNVNMFFKSLPWYLL